MKALLYWVVIVTGATLGLLFGDAAVRGTILMLACFIALGALARSLDAIKKAGKE